MAKWKYSIEVRRRDGTWSHGIVWACRPEDFRALLTHTNRSRVQTRIRRVYGTCEPNYHWPEDKKVQSRTLG
jgi:hypothetical protein